MMRIKFAERKITANRSEIVALAADRYDVHIELTPAMLDAEREIAQTFTYTTPGMGYATIDPMRTDRGESPEPEGVELERIKTAQAYLSKWNRACNPILRGIVLDILCFAMEIDQVAYQRGLRRSMVIKAYRDGLEEYCYIRGWGEKKSLQ